MTFDLFHRLLIGLNSLIVSSSITSISKLDHKHLHISFILVSFIYFCFYYFLINFLFIPVYLIFPLYTVYACLFYLFLFLCYLFWFILFIFSILLFFFILGNSFFLAYNFIQSGLFYPFYSVETGAGDPHCEHDVVRLRQTYASLLPSSVPLQKCCGPVMRSAGAGGHRGGC